MAIGAILGCLAASTIGGMFGRRPVYFGMCLLSFLSASYLFRFLTEFNLWFMFVVFVVGGITAAFYGWLPLYLPELFPTRIRATGQGLSFNFGRILAAGGTLCLGQFFGALWRRLRPRHGRRRADLSAGNGRHLVRAGNQRAAVAGLTNMRLALSYRMELNYDAIPVLTCSSAWR